jgi:hypothetical protein
MKFKTISTCLLFLLLWSFFSAHRIDPNNPPTGKTGGPGESTCAESTCHSGGTFTGSVKLSGVPDTVVANQTYALVVSNLSNANKAGFQLTCLDASNVKAGTISSASGVNVTTANNRQYARQSSPKTFATTSDSVSWTFNWKAPATMANNTATFYFISLCANGNGAKTGDNVLLGNKTIHLAAVSSSDEPATPRVAVYPTQVNDILHLRLEDARNAEVRLTDLQGKVLYRQTMSDQADIPVHELPQGIFLVHVQAGKFRYTQKCIKM